MNNFGQLSLYDFLTMLLVGFLLLVPFCDTGCGESFISGTLLLAASYIIGLCYHKLIEKLTAPFRNMKCMIMKAYDAVCKEFPNVSNLKTGRESYYREYYRLMMKGCLGNIPVLEAQVAFIRNLIPVLIVYIIAIACECENLDTLIVTIFGYNSHCGVAIIIGILLMLLPYLWYSVQMKIHKLVWEGGYFVQSICNTQNHQAQQNPTQIP